MIKTFGWTKLQYIITRRLLIFAILINLPICTNAKSAKSWIKELDHVDITALYSGDVYSFWSKERNADYSYTNLQQAIRENKKSMRKAVLNIQKFLSSSFSERLFSVRNDSVADSICSNIEKDLHIDDLRSFLPDNIEFKIAKKEGLNAATFPDGYIMIYKGVLEKLQYEELLAVCAHELAHYMFKHSLANEYAYIKKQKSNRLWAEIGGGILIGAAAFADGYSAGITGQRLNNTGYYASLYQGIIDDADQSSEMFRFRYSRKEELQADIIGFRYLQFLGYNPRAFLTMLEKIGTENDKYYNKKSSHPRTQLRIDVINSLLSEL